MCGPDHRTSAIEARQAPFSSGRDVARPPHHVAQSSQRQNASTPSSLIVNPPLPSASRGVPSPIDPPSLDASSQFSSTSFSASASATCDRVFFVGARLPAGLVRAIAPSAALTVLFGASTIGIGRRWGAAVGSASSVGVASSLFGGRCIGVKIDDQLIRNRIWIVVKRDCISFIQPAC